MKNTALTIKLHPILLQAVQTLLLRIFKQHEYADKAVPDLLKRNTKWGARDRQFVAETTYDLVRWWRKYWYMLGIEPQLEPTALHPLIALSLLSRGYAILNPEALNLTDLAALQQRLYTPISALAVEQAIPDWLYYRFRESYNDDYLRLLFGALNAPPQVVLRVNTLKTTLPQLVKQFEKEQIATEPIVGAPDALLLSTRRNLLHHASYLQGWFEFQDAGSQQISAFCKVKKGMTVLDLCAGAGGKTLHLAALMQNKGQLVAADLHKHRLTQLYKRAERAGVGGLLQITNLESLARYENSADVVLLDAPCSGTGVLRRNPDTKWKLTETDWLKLLDTQAELLATHQTLVRGGGVLVYATCSVLPQENEQQIARFLAQHPQFSLEASCVLLPHVDGFDGFYMARLRKM